MSFLFMASMLLKSFLFRVWQRDHYQAGPEVYAALVLNMFFDAGLFYSLTTGIVRALVELCV